MDCKEYGKQIKGKPARGEKEKARIQPRERHKVNRENRKKKSPSKERRAEGGADLPCRGGDDFTRPPKKQLGSEEKKKLPAEQKGTRTDHASRKRSRSRKFSTRKGNHFCRNKRKRAEDLFQREERTPELRGPQKKVPSCWRIPVPADPKGKESNRIHCPPRPDISTL